jgi:CelD/BcsL family acetyltransferase involved in cellulose biosynthesis
LLFIYKNDRPISSVLLLKSDDTCMMYQSGLDPSYSSVEPGYQTNLAAIEYAIGEGFRYFDFLRGDEPYKARWSTTREPIVRRKYVPPKLKSQLWHGTWVIGRSIKHYVTGIGQSDVVTK